VWISAWGNGLNHWQNGKITVWNKSNGLSSDFVMAMTEGRDGSLWVGTDYGSTLNRIKDGRVTFLGREQGFVASVTTALLEDDTGRLWMGSRVKTFLQNRKQSTLHGCMPVAPLAPGSPRGASAARAVGNADGWQKYHAVRLHDRDCADRIPDADGLRDLSPGNLRV
jgi:hypothetical protein